MRLAESLCLMIKTLMFFSEIIVKLRIYSFILKIECFRNMKAHFPCLTILILIFFEIFFITKKFIS